MIFARKKKKLHPSFVDSTFATRTHETTEGEVKKKKEDAANTLGRPAG